MKMLEQVAEADASKLEIQSRLGVEEDALLAMLGDSEGDMAAKVARTVIALSRTRQLAPTKSNPNS